MIDVESQIYTSIAVALRETFPGIDVSGEYVKAPSAFPHVSIVEQNNYPTPEHLSTSDKEQFATLMYEINVYSNKSTSKKNQCRNIVKAIDDLMYQRNLTRVSLSSIPNLENTSTYRLVVRHRAETDGTNLYRRQVEMVINTYKVFLVKKGASANTYEKLIDIEEFPDLGGGPKMLETTTLSDNMQTYIADIQSLDGLPFTANYDMATFKKLKELEGKEDGYAAWFGGTESGGVVTPDGSDGKFAFKGQLSVFPVGGGVNEVVNMNISIASSTPITFSDT